MIGSKSSRSGRTLKEDGKFINTADYLYMTQTSLGQSIGVESTTQFSYKSVFPFTSQRDEKTETSGGTVGKVNGAEYRVRATATAGSVAQIQTKQLGDYIPEYVFLPSMGVRIPEQPTGNAKVQFGYFDGQNGTFLEYNANGLFHKVLSGGVEKYSKEINGISVVEGNVFRFPFLFYGYGYAGVDIPTLRQGSFQAERQSTYYPNGELVFQDSNLPLTVRVESDGTQLDAFVAGRQMGVIGKNEKLFRTVNAVRKEQSIANSTDYVPMVSVRLKSDFKQVFAQLLKVTNISNANMETALIVNGTLTGDTFGAPEGYNANEVATEWDNSATAITGGDKIHGSISQGDNKDVLTSVDLPDLPLVEGDVISFCLRLISGSNGTSTLNAEVRENW